MSRIRVLLASMCLVVIAIAFQVEIQAQAPGGRDGGGQRGGGPGGGGQRGGRGRNSNFGLLAIATVQKELKLTEEQISLIKEASDTLDQQRREMMKGMGQGQRRNNRNRQGNGGENGFNPGGGGFNPGGDGGFNPGGGGNGFNPDGTANGGNGGGQPNWMAMFTAFRENEERALGKILSKAQRVRLAQIALQQEGPMAVVRPDIQDRLNMSFEQREQIQDIMRGMGEERRQMFRQNRGGGNRGGGGQDGNGQGGNAPGGNAGRRDGGGFDREAFKKMMESPEFKARMAEMKSQGELLEKRTILALSKVLTKGQKANFNKMQGKPFDITGADAEATDKSAGKAKTSKSKATASTGSGKTKKKSSR